uniref:Alpha-2-macroglobulin bait region domain-containing protein n=1 Tax=Pelusios castaneus TaxID=367368 RepID=A0A8C8S1X4_9SAUR
WRTWSGQYLLMVPSVLQSGSPNQACLQLHNLNESLSVSVVLEYSSANTTIFEQSVRRDGFFQCIAFTPPRATSSPLAFITFSGKGATVRLAERRSIAILNVDSVDPQGNRIFQWLNVTSENAIVQLTFQLIKEPTLGNYQITVEKKSGSSTHHFFYVEEYVLPKFEVTVHAPKSVSVLNLDFKVKVCGTSPERRTWLFPCSLTVSFPSQMGKDGCISQVFSSKIFELNRSGYQMALHVKAVVMEKGTGVQLTGSAYIPVTLVLGSVRFENMDQSYKRGIPYFGQVGQLQGEISVYSFLLFLLSCQAIYKTSDNCNAVGWLLPFYPEAHYSVHRFYSRTNSFVKIEPEPEVLSCGHQTVKIVLTTHYLFGHLLELDFSFVSYLMVSFYAQVMAKGKIVLSGRQQVLTSGALKGTFSISLAVSEKLAPAAQIFVYTVHPARELVADSARFQIEKCFKNKVQLQFSEKQGLPASNISLHLEAAANSHCALRAVDESVLLLRPEQELSAETVYNLLPLQQLYGYYFNGLNLEDDSKEPCVPADNIFHNGLYYMPVSSDFGTDVYLYIKASFLGPGWNFWPKLEREATSE